MTSFDYGSAEPQFMGGGSYLPKGRHVVQVDAYETREVNGHPTHSIDVSNGEGIQKIDLHVMSNGSTTGRIVGFIDSVGLDRPKAGEFDPETGALSDAYLNKTLGKSLVINCVETLSRKDPDSGKMYSEVQSFDRVKGGSDVTTSSDVGQYATKYTADDSESVPF